MAKLWTVEEIDLLTKSYEQKAPIKDIAEQIGRTEKAIKNKAHKLGVANSNSFTDEEIDYIRENYRSYNLREIAEKLGREKNYHNICRKAKELGLERTGKKKQKIKVRTVKFKTKEERNLFYSNQLKERIKKNGHPRGMLGKTHSQEYRKELSERVKRDWENRSEKEIKLIMVKSNKTKIKNGTLNSHKNRSNPYSYAKGGKRKDLKDVYFRSAWEANVARVMNHKLITWEYEPKQFIFEGIYEGAISYTPDFYLPSQDKWVEVKGWMDNKSKLKLERFKQYFPQEYSKLILINETEYKNLENEFSNKINNWE